MDRRVIHIVNPAAGQRSAAARVEAQLRTSVGELYLTQGRGDAERYIAALCRECGGAYELHFVIHGGDGTVYETVNGILSADAGAYAVFSAVPVGSGNDFIRSAVRSDVYTRPPAITDDCEHDIDAIAYTVSGQTRYAVNMLNIGFDCSVVVRAGKMKEKPLVSGSGAYILGVLDVLLRKEALDCTISLRGVDGQLETMTGKRLLLVMANGLYCGGGFRAAPLAKLDDGLLDVLVVNDMTRLQFLSLVKDYRAGTHVDPVSGMLTQRFQTVMSYWKCTAVTVDSIGEVCADGEVSSASEVSCRVIPRALRYVNLP